MTDRDTLALAAFVEGSFRYAGLSSNFKASTPLSLELLSLVGEDLLTHETLVDAAIEGLSVREMLLGQKTPIRRPAYWAQLAWTRVRNGSDELEDRCGAEVYVVQCGRCGVVPHEFITRARSRLLADRRARAKRRIAVKLKLRKP